jgi:Protein of unknown function (DUF2911)
MRIHKLYIALGLILALGLFFELAAHADEANQETRITFSAPIQIPGQVLPAGTYMFQLADPNNSQDLARIFNADRGVLNATVETASAERRNPTADTAITLAERESGKPDVLVNWFYRGNTSGHEFIYPKRQEQEIAQGQAGNIRG